MADIEKVIKAIKLCFNPTGKCKECPYDELGAVPSCTKALGADVIELLKEQQGKIEKAKIWLSASGVDLDAMCDK